MSSSNLLKGKIALITGSNRGIGKAIAETFAQNGADIIACARKDTTEFKELTISLSEKYGISVKPLFFDLCNKDEIKKALLGLLHDKCKIDILVNNAGIAHGGFLQMTPINKIEEVFEINFFSQLLIIQFISKLMIRQKSGSIINMASITGIDSFPGYIAYGSSKAALIHATKTLSCEFAPYNIRINAIAPALTKTDMAELMEQKARDGIIENSAMKRMATPQEVANMALFLASDLSTFVNGQVLRVDGGM